MRQKCVCGRGNAVTGFGGGKEYREGRDMEKAMEGREWKGEG